jgi:hypothetical protein
MHVQSRWSFFYNWVGRHHPGQNKTDLLAKRIMIKRIYLQSGLNGLKILRPIPRFRRLNPTPVGETNPLDKNPTVTSFAGVATSVSGFKVVSV